MQNEKLQSLLMAARDYLKYCGFGPRPRIIDLSQNKASEWLFYEFMRLDTNAVDYSQLTVHHSNGLQVEDIGLDRICAFASLSGTLGIDIINAGLPVEDVRRKVLLASSL